jgi:hypothetical protein
VLAENARNLAIHSPSFDGHDRSVVAPNKTPDSPGFQVSGFRFPVFSCVSQVPARTTVRRHHNPVLAENARNMAIHSPPFDGHDRIVVAPNKSPDPPGFPVSGFRFPVFSGVSQVPARTSVRRHHNPVVAANARNMAIHSPSFDGHDRSVMAPNKTRTLRVFRFQVSGFQSSPACRRFPLERPFGATTILWLPQM